MHTCSIELTPKRVCGSYVILGRPIKTAEYAKPTRKPGKNIGLTLSRELAEAVSLSGGEYSQAPSGPPEG